MKSNVNAILSRNSSMFTKKKDQDKCLDLIIAPLQHWQYVVDNEIKYNQQNDDICCILNESGSHKTRVLISIYVSLFYVDIFVFIVSHG